MAGSSLLVAHLLSYPELPYPPEQDLTLEQCHGPRATILMGPSWAIEVVPAEDGVPEHITVSTMAGTWELATTEAEVYAELGIVSTAEAAEAASLARVKAVEERQSAIRRAILTGTLSAQEIAILKAELAQLGREAP